jgi:hypothetical protein
VSFLPTTGRMPRCWMIDGFSKPKAELAKTYHKRLSEDRDWGSAIQSYQRTSNPKFNWFINLLFFLFLAYYKQLWMLCIFENSPKLCYRK